MGNWNNRKELKDRPARTPVCHQCLFSWCRASGFIALGRRTLFFFFLSLFLSTLFLLAYFHAINFLISTTLILKHPMNLLSFSLNWLQMIKPVEQSIPDPLRQAISLSDKYDTYVETSIRDTIKKGELLLCVGPGRSFLRIFISSPAHTAEQNTFLTESHVNFNAQKIHPLFCCLDSPDLALLSLSRNAGLLLPALCDREREREKGQKWTIF